MAKDISEELYAKIKESFDRKYEKAQLLGEPLHDVLARIQSGAGTFRDADMYAVEVGSMISDSLKENITLDKLPNKTFYQNIAQKTLGVSLKDGYGMVSNIAAVIQEEMNEVAGIGLKAVKPKLEVKAVDKVVDGAVQAKTQDELDAALTEPVKTFTRRVVDDTQKANARLHNKAGLAVKVEREYDGVGIHNQTEACQWCLDRAGKFTYEEAMDKGAFERHDGCGCIITYTSKKGEVSRSTGKYGGFRQIDNPGKKERELQKAIADKTKIGIINKKEYAASIFDTKWEKVKIDAIKKMQHGFSAFPVDDILSVNASKVTPKSGYYDVAMHGNDKAVGIGTRKANMNARDLARIIVKQSDYHGEPIRLLSCETGVKPLDGGYCFAEELANALGKEVLAPNDVLYIYRDGSFKIGIYGDGDLIPFTPNMRRRIK